MASLQRLTPHNVGAPPYKSRFSTVTIVPPNTPIAYISTQWAADPATGDMVTGGKGSYYHQAKQVWTNIVAILEELGVGLEACVHRQVNYLEFNDKIAEEVFTAEMEVAGEKGRDVIFALSLTYCGPAHFHRPDILYTMEMIVALPPKK